MKHSVFSRLTHLPKRGPRTALLAVLLAVVLGVGMFALAPAPSAHAATIATARGSVTVIMSRHSSPSLIPNTASGCVGNLPWNNVQTCFTIVGSGTYVQDMWVSAYVRNSPVTAALIITGPAGFAVSTSGFTLLTPGDTLVLYVQPNRNMPTGKYCGRSELISGTGAGTACESVVA
jgi:hypothetical protein